MKIVNKLQQGNVIRQDNTKVYRPPKFSPIKARPRQDQLIDLGGKPTPDITYQQRWERQKRERRWEDTKNLIGGLNKTIGRAASLASFAYGGGWAATRLLNGNKSSAIGQVLSKYVLPTNSLDAVGDVSQLIEDPSVSNATEVGVSLGLGKWKDFSKVGRQAAELGSQALNLFNSFKDGGSIKQTNTQVKRFKNNEEPKVIKAQEGVKFSTFTPVEQAQIEVTPTSNPFSELNFATPEVVPTKSEPVQETVQPQPTQTTVQQTAPQGNPSVRVSKGLVEFNKHFDSVAKSHPEIIPYRKFLTKTAEQESGFNSAVQNKAGAPCYGYFQMKDSNIRQAGMTVDSFRKSPEAQILAAFGLAKRFESGFSQQDRNLAAQKGYTKFGLLGGAWLGGNAGMRKVLNGTGNPTDKKWSKGRFGTSVKDRSSMFNFN